MVLWGSFPPSSAAQFTRNMASCSNRILSARHHHGDVVAVEQYLIQLRNLPALGRRLTERDKHMMLYEIKTQSQ